MFGIVQEYQVKQTTVGRVFNGSAHLLILECDFKSPLGYDFAHTVLALVGATALVVHFHLRRQVMFLLSYFQVRLDFGCKSYTHDSALNATVHLKRFGCTWWY